GDLRDLDRAAEIVLEHVLRDVRVRRRSRPGLLVEHDRAASRTTGRRAAGNRQHGHDREHESACDPGLHETSGHAVLLFPFLYACAVSDHTLSLLARLARVPCVTRSRAMPRARIASDATTPNPNSPRWRPWATRYPRPPEPTN